MTQIISEFDMLSELRERINDVKIFYIFSNVCMKSNMKDMKCEGYNVFIVYKNEEIYGLGQNSMNLLGLGSDKPMKKLTIIPELCDKEIIDFANGISHCIGRSLNGKVYKWGKNDFGQMGEEAKDKSFHKPIQVSISRDENVAKICCGSYHTLCLTESGKLYAFGSNKWGQLGINSKKNHSKPSSLHGFNGEKIVMISCGSWHSIVLTKSGRILSWGLNRYGQLGNGNTVDCRKPQVIKIVDNNAEIVAFDKISCGSEHSLLLSQSGNIFAFGRNDFGQLGSISEKTIIPLKIDYKCKFIEIKSHHFFDISTALSANGYYHIWGKCGEEAIQMPKETKFESFTDIFKHFHRITYEVIDPVKYDSIPRRSDGKLEKEFTDEILISSDGSFGIVFKALSKTDSKKYAIKKISASQDEFELIFKELEIMRSLRSIHVVEYVHSWIEMNYYHDEICKSKISDKINYKHRVFDAKKPFLIHIQMELGSKTLRKLIDELKDNQEMTSLFYYTLCKIFLDIVESVNFLHKHNPQIIHRDLKPDNILIMDEFKEKIIKLADFGLAVKHEFKSQSHTEDTGTAKYMAPEVVRSRKYDTKSDIFSLGVIFEELFGFGDKVICNGDEELLAERYSELEKLKNEMLENDKNLRPSCDEIIEEIKRLSLTSRDLETNPEFKRLLYTKFDISFLFTLLIYYLQNFNDNNSTDDNSTDDDSDSSGAENTSYDSLICEICGKSIYTPECI